jgi:hypothetical protein
LIVVRTCIGCGAVDTPQVCLGTCVEHRLDLVRADQHAVAAARLADAERSLAELRAVVAQAAAGEGDWHARQAVARAALRGLSALTVPAAGAVVTTWACSSCGRIEAPQPCIGVCVKPETPMVRAAQHGAVIERGTAARRELARLAPLVRRLAWVTPRAGQRERTERALMAQARELGVW